MDVWILELFSYNLGSIGFSKDLPNPSKSLDLPRPGFIDKKLAMQTAIKVVFFFKKLPTNALKISDHLVSGRYRQPQLNLKSFNL